MSDLVQLDGQQPHSEPTGQHVEQAVRERYSAASREREASLCCPVQYDGRYLARNPYMKAPAAAVSIARDGKYTDLHRISPLEIEEVITEVPSIEEVAVLGVPDELLGQTTHAG